MTTPSSPHALFQSRGWLIFGGILSIVVGFIAMRSPVVFSVVLVQFLGIVLVVSGLISLFVAIFDKHVAHRWLTALAAVIRLAAGGAMFLCIASSMAVITLILAIFLMMEGIAFIIGAFKLRSHKGWVWTLINGIAALALGVMIYMQWPWSGAWVLGLFFGINCLFSGVSLLMLGIAAGESPREA